MNNDFVAVSFHITRDQRKKFQTYTDQGIGFIPLKPYLTELLLLSKEFTEIPVSIFVPISESFFERKTMFNRNTSPHMQACMEIWIEGFTKNKMDFWRNLDP